MSLKLKKIQAVTNISKIEQYPIFEIQLYNKSPIVFNTKSEVKNNSRSNRRRQCPKRWEKGCDGSIFDGIFVDIALKYHFKYIIFKNKSWL